MYVLFYFVNFGRTYQNRFRLGCKEFNFPYNAIKPCKKVARK